MYEIIWLINSSIRLKFVNIEHVFCQEKAKRVKKVVSLCLFQTNEKEKTKGNCFEFAILKTRVVVDHGSSLRTIELRKLDKNGIGIGTPMDVLDQSPRLMEFRSV